MNYDWPFTIVVGSVPKIVVLGTVGNLPPFPAPWALSHISIFEPSGGSGHVVIQGITDNLPFDVTDPNTDFEVTPVLDLDSASIITLTGLNFVGGSLQCTFSVSGDFPVPEPPIIYPGPLTKLSLPEPAFKCKC